MASSFSSLVSRLPSEPAVDMKKSVGRIILSCVCVDMSRGALRVFAYYFFFKAIPKDSRNCAIKQSERIKTHAPAMCASF